MNNKDRIKLLKLKKQRLELEKSGKAPDYKFDTKTPHPDFSGPIDIFKRAGIKNLAEQTPEGYLKAINMKYPEMDAKIHKGQVLIKDNADGVYKALDPKTGFFSSDFAGDALDIGGDIAQGLAETAGTVGGAIAGAAGGLGIGAIPGAMAGGAASGAATEGIRQAMGKYLGYKEDIDGTMVAINSGLGALTPILLGSGSAGKTGLKALAKKGMSKEAFDMAGRGLIKRGKDKIAPKALSIITGVDEQLIRQFPKYADEIKTMTQVPHYLAKKIGRVRESVVDGVKESMDSAGKRLSYIKESIDGPVDISRLKGELDEYRKVLRSRYKDSGLSSDLDNYISFRQTQKDLLKGQRRPYVKDGIIRSTRQLPDEVSSGTVDSIRNRISEIAKMANTQQALKPKFGKSDRAINKQMSHIFKNGYFDIKNALGDSVERAGKFSRDEFMDANKKYSKLSDFRKNLATKVEKDGGFEGFIDSSIKGNKVTTSKMLDEAASMSGTGELINDTQMLKRYATELVTPKKGAIQSTMNTLQNNAVLKNAAIPLGYYAGSQIDGGFGSAKIGGAGLGLLATMVGNPKFAAKRLLAAEARKAFRNRASAGLRRGVYSQMAEGLYDYSNSGK